jgi:glutamate dehydrogenase (NADP+)
MELSSFMEHVVQRNPGQTEFHQAVREVATKVIPFINQNPKYERARILERLSEPDRVIMFRVTWEDDNQNIHVNRGYRVQHSNAIGPYKGGLRFDPSVTLSVLKFLAFEQVFKNSLTTLPMGGGKGGSDFNPKGKSDSEVMRFCQAFMTGLHTYIGEDVDVPAGDIGVGGREIGYLFGQYKRLQNKFTGALTGKGLPFGGSVIRTEATGYGCVYLGRDMLVRAQKDMEGMKCVISGSGNVAQYAAQKLLDFGAQVMTLSDRTGYVYFPSGLTSPLLNEIIDLKTNQRRTLREFAEERKLDFHEDADPWNVPCDAAFPCAMENELDANDAKALLNNGCHLVCEGANMPVTFDGAHMFEDAGILYAPCKAANAGGVAISGLEMTQNSIRLSWSRDEVDQRLRSIMHNIDEQCAEYGRDGNGHVNYVKGANIAGFVKVADALLAYGVM